MVRNKSKQFDEHQKLMKYLESNVYVHKPINPIYPDVALMYPIIPWTFWYRKPKKMQSNNQWEESLTEIETVQDITHLWK